MCMPRIPLARRRVCALFISLLSCAACASRAGGPVATEPSFEIAVRATTDADAPLEGVALRIGPSHAVLTAADGLARLRTDGRTGDSVEVQATCPDGYVSPAAPLAVTLYHVVSGAIAPARSVVCTRSSRRVIAAIRVDRPARLPIVRLGKTIGVTDELGAAHVTVDAKPGEPIELTLDTSALPLRPHSPTLSFVMPDRDELLVLEQSFEMVVPPPRVPTKRSRRPSVPTSSLPSRI